MRRRQFRLGLFALLGCSAAMSVAACGDDETTASPSSTTTSTTTSTGGAGGMGGASTSTAQGGQGAVGGAGTGGAGGAGGSFAGQANCDAPMGSPAALTLAPVTSVQGSPLLVTADWSDPSRIYIVTQQGRIFVREGGTDSLFLDLTGSTQSAGERGLLGLAFHPDYAQNGRFFVHYTANGDTTRLEEYQRSADPNVAEPAPVGAPLFELTQPAGNHNGGSIEFGQDGYLYMGIGDGGGANDQYDHGQNKMSAFAAVVRLDISTNPPTIPAGNITDGAPEVFDWGLRNPFRMSFDRCNSDLYIGDVGQNEVEEIDVHPFGTGNLNWGWNTMEGDTCFQSNNCDQTGLSLPAVAYPQPGGQNCAGSVTGGYVYRGTLVPWLRGAYIYGDFCSGDVWYVRYENGTTSAPVSLTTELGTADQPISSFGQDANGEVYVVYRSGAISRIESQ